MSRTPHRPAVLPCHMGSRVCCAQPQGTADQPLRGGVLASGELRSLGLPHLAAQGGQVGRVFLGPRVTFQKPHVFIHPSAQAGRTLGPPIVKLLCVELWCWRDGRGVVRCTAAGRDRDEIRAAVPSWHRVLEIARRRAWAEGRATARVGGDAGSTCRGSGGKGHAGTGLVSESWGGVGR